MVATIEVPASHHGRFLPERKNSLMLDEALRVKYTPTARDKAMYAEIIIQSKRDRVIAVILYSMPEWISQLDARLFFFLNSGCSNGMFDLVMPLITKRANVVIIPFLLYFVIREKKKALVIIAVSIFSVLLADGASNVLKHLIGRQRPCNVFENVHLLVGCSASFSMPSSHAANSFAFAVPFLFMTKNRLKLLFMGGAVLVSLSRVLVGVHYPGDVLAGAFAGSLAAGAVMWLYRWSERRFMNRPYATVMYVFLLALSLFRLYYLLHGPLDLSPDEAHYWEWSRRPDLSYYSKGPMISYLIAMSTFLFGDTVFGVRFLAVLLSLLSSILLYRLGKDMYDERTGAASAMLLQVIPLFSTFGVIFTIDSPFVFFWILSLHLFWKAVGSNELSVTSDMLTLRGDGRGRSKNPSLATGYQSMIYWLLLGISVGLGLLTKYTMAFFYLCAFVFFLSSPAQRRLLLTSSPYLSFLASLAVFSPVIIWNAGHDWVTLRHTAGQAHVADGLRISLKSFVEFAGSQMGVVTPVLFVMMMVALWKIKGIENVIARSETTEQPHSSGTASPFNCGTRNDTGQAIRVVQDRGKFLFWFSVPVVVFFLLKSLQGKVQANWAMTGYLAGLISFSAVYLREWGRNSHFTRNIVITGILLAVIVSALGYYPSKFHLPLKLDPTARLRGWSGLGKEVSSILREMNGKRDVFIFSDGYQVSSELAFYVEGHPVTYCANLGRRMNQYDLWPGFDDLIHYNGIFVTIGDTELHPRVKDAFNSCEKRRFQAFDKERLLRQYSIFLCHDFKGMEKETTGEY